MNATSNTPGRQHDARPRWSLRLRLTLVTVFTVLLATGIGIYVDYRREYRVHGEEMLDALQDEAKALNLARGLASDRAHFATYVDRLCGTVNEGVAPGHHILVLNADGSIAVDATHHSGRAVTRALLSTDKPQSVLAVGDRQLLQARLKGDDGVTVIVAQYFDVVQQLLRTQLISRAVTVGVLTVALTVLVFMVVNGWVLNPVVRLISAARAWTDRDFAARSTPSGSPEMRALADTFNTMASELDRTEQAREAELDRARQIQKNLLPAAVPPVQGMSLATVFRPAAFVAGDLYDIFPLEDGRTAIFVLDVAGHGVSAALLTAVVKMSFQRWLTELDDLPEVVRAVNRDLLKCAADGTFVTACVGVWSPSEHRWTYCAAGHGGGLLIRDGQMRLLPSTGAVLGVMSEEGWQAMDTSLQPGDRVILFTDGLTDAGEPGEPLGVEGLKRLLTDSSADPLEHQMRLIADHALTRCANSYCDDITMVGFAIVPDNQPGHYRVL